MYSFSAFKEFLIPLWSGGDLSRGGRDKQHFPVPYLKPRERGTAKSALDVIIFLYVQIVCSNVVDGHLEIKTPEASTFSLYAFSQCSLQFAALSDCKIRTAAQTISYKTVFAMVSICLQCVNTKRF